MKYRRYLFFLMVFMAVAILQACGSNSSSSSNGNATSAGTLSVLVTDAPGDFDHAYITVKDIWFHTSSTAGPNDAGWVKKPLAAPVTVDLLTLANGGMRSLWSGVSLAVGNYQQIRLILAGTEDALTASAQTMNLQYNNEVVIGGTASPLHVPDALHGIKLDGVFTMTAGGTLRLAIDFDAGHDIVDFRTGEYVLKPRLTYFDLDHAGAIIGKLALASGGSVTTPRFVIKAERLTSDGTNTYHMVRRWTVPKPDGTFILYPVSTLVTGTWDVVVRGLGYQTVIIKGVPITTGSTPASGATDLGTITMTAAGAPDYAVTGAIASPTGSWVQFYQTLPGSGEYPYEIRFRHFNPLTGAFTAPFPLSNDVLQVGTYGTPTITLTPMTPVGGSGSYRAAAGAVLYDRSAYQTVSSASMVSFGSLTVSSPYQGNTVTGMISMATSTMNSMMNRGVLFAVQGGMIVNAINIGSNGGGQIVSGGTYTFTNLPGGSVALPLHGAFYGIEAVGWSSLTTAGAFAIPQVADLRTGNDRADMTMLPLP